MIDQCHRGAVADQCHRGAVAYITTHKKEMFFLDTTQTFDRIRHDGLILKLTTTLSGGNFCKLMQSLVSTLRIKCLSQ